MKNVNFYLVLLCLLCSCSSETKKSERELAGIKGCVKSIMTIEYKAVDKFGEGQIVKDIPQSYGSQYLGFDSIGNVLESKLYYLSKCNKSGEAIYDMNGRLIKWISYDEEDDSKIKYGSKYQYDEKGNKIKEIDLLDESVYVLKYEFNDKGQIISKDDKYDTYYYEYKDDKIVKETNKNKILNSLSSVASYEFDNKGNLIKKLTKYNDGDIRNMLYKNDDNNRRIDCIVTNNDDPNKGDIISRTKLFYANEKAFIPNHSKTWGKNGEVESENYIIWFYNQRDTFATLYLNKDYNITAIENTTKGKDLLTTTTGYSIESEPYVHLKYNYSDGILTSTIDNDGHTTLYEYDKNELVKVTAELSEGKTISTYKDGKPINLTCYDKHNKIETSSDYTYEGNSKNGKTIIKKLDSDKTEHITEIVIKEGLITKQIERINGISEILDFVYNKQGDIVSISSSNGDKRKFTYKYDPFNNWIQKVSYNNDEVEFITERAISYY